MGIDNRTSTTGLLRKTGIEIYESNGQLGARPLEAEVGPGDVVEWVAPFEFVLDFGGRDDSPVSYGQYEFVSSPTPTGGHRVAIVARHPTHKRRLGYDIRTLNLSMDPALIIDPNKMRRPGIA